MTSHRVLLVSEDPRESDLLQAELAQAQGSPIVVFGCATMDEAIRRLEQHDVDLVLLDAEGGEAEALERFQRLDGAFPDVPVVILTTPDGEAVAVEAVRAGAETCLLKGWGLARGGRGWRSALATGDQGYLVRGVMDREELARELRLAIVHHEAHATVPHRRRVIAVLGARGGVGTSTVALNAAAELARQGRKVALAELASSRGSFATQLSEPVATCLDQILDAPLADVGPMVEQALVRVSGGLRVLFGPQRSVGLKPLDGPHARAIVAALAGAADVVVLDLQDGWSPVLQDALCLVQQVVLVTDAEATSIDAANWMIRMLPACGVGRSTLSVVVVVTRAFGESVSMSGIERDLARPILKVIPRSDEPCRRAARAGRPLVLEEPQDDAAQAMRDLAKVLLNEPPAPRPSPGNDQSRSQPPHAVHPS